MTIQVIPEAQGGAGAHTWDKSAHGVASYYVRNGASTVAYITFSGETRDPPAVLDQLCQILTDTQGDQP